MSAAPAPPADAAAPAAPTLPVEAARPAFEAALDAGPVVFSAPTGAGKSTAVPRWLAARGAVLVVEPRRVACRALAARVADLDGVAAGGAVGWIVRDERRADPDARIVFVTPGVALRLLRTGEIARFETVVLDEFHERSLDLDLLLALLLGTPTRLVVMSATLAADRIAAHMGGRHVHAEGRIFPVERRHLAQGAQAPDGEGVARRVLGAVRAASELPGDILVFLPGKAEIRESAAALGGLGLDILELHGGLRLDDQARIFSPGPRRRVVLATNVAETSLTVPRVGVVIDSGLVRSTRYRKGRGHLSLLPVAADSADQRAGRAGRLGPGVAIALWPPEVRLAERTPPEIHREALETLVLAGAACGHPGLDLPFLDPPQAHAVHAAREQLALLGAVDAAGAITPRGERLFGMPLDARLGRLLVEGHAAGEADVIVPLVAALSLTRRLFGPRPEDPGDDLRAAGCDAVALVRAVTEGEAGRHGLDRAGLDEARAGVRRLWRVLGAPPPPRRPVPFDRAAVAKILLAAWPDAAHVARRRKRSVAWSNGGTELELGRSSAMDADKTETAIVLDSIALTVSHRSNPLVITAAMPVPARWVLDAGIGRRRLAAPLVERGRVMARIETVHAGKVLATEETRPTGALLREAVRDLVLANRLFKGAARTLHSRLERVGLQAGLDGGPQPEPAPEWLLARLTDLGLEAPDDLALLEVEDLLPDALAPHQREALDREFPRSLEIGDARYRIAYDPQRRVAVLHQQGTRKDPPPERFLPRLPGWRIDWEHRKRVRCVRKRR